MIKKLNFLLFTLLFSTFYASSNYFSQKELQDLNKTETLKAKHYKESVLQIKTSTIPKAAKQEDKAKSMSDIGRKKWIEGMAKLQSKYVDPQRIQAMKKQYQGLIVFASLGMPDNSLRALIKQAAQVQAPVIIRGLYKNSMMLTAKKIMSLINTKGNEKPIGGIMIDPAWFSMYEVKTVPTFVITKQFNPCNRGQQCKVADYDMLSGNISVKDALRLFKNKGQTKFLPVVNHFLSLTKGGNNA